MTISRRKCFLLFVAFLALPAMAQLSVTVSGNTIFWHTPSGYCCGGASLGPTFVDSAGCSVVSGNNCSLAPAQSGAFTCNRPGGYQVTGCWYNGDGSANPPKTCETKSVTVSDPVPVTCPFFTLSARTPIVLTHKYGPEDYPQGQSRDAQLEFTYKPVSVANGTTIYFRVFDPRDPSSYRTNVQSPDNIDGSGGKIALSPSDTGSKTLSITSGEDPVTIYLNTTGFAAGDNYTIQASADPGLSSPSYVCGAGCIETQAVTAWKRVYLEKHTMYRSGVFVAAPASSGQNQVTIQVPRDAAWRDVRLNAGDSIKLLHAPRFDGLDLAPDFYSEDAVITAVDSVPGFRNRRLLTLAGPLTHSYENDTSYTGAIDDGVSDGVVDPAQGIFGRNESYLNAAFGPAFLQFYDVPQKLDSIPYVPIVRRIEHVANKWFENTTVNLATLARPGRENVKHVLAGSETFDDATTQTFGMTGVYATGAPATVVQFPTPNMSWTFVAKIEYVCSHHGPFRNKDPWIFNGENLVHELAHTFSVNSTASDYGHCSGQKMAGSTTLNCMMMAPSDPLFVPAQKTDGIVGFHYVSDNDSEYMTIRNAIEPLTTPVH